MSEKSVDRWAAFRGLSWWQVVLALAPLALIAVGGLIGGIFGGGAAAINLKIARLPWHPAASAAAMIGVGAVAVVAYVLVAGALLDVLNG